MEKDRGMMFVAVLAFLTRIPLFSLNDGLLYDEALYLSIGKNLSENLLNYTMNFNYMTYRPPFLPYLISLFFRLNVPEDGARLISPLFSTATIILTYHFAKKHFSQRTAVLSSLILISSPLFLKYSLRILTHEAYAFFYTLSVFLFFEGFEKKRKLFWAGAIAGLAYLTRYVGLMFFSFVFFYTIFKHRKNLGDLITLPLKNVHLIGCIFSFLVVVAPWSICNYIIYKDPFKYSKVASSVISLDFTTTFKTFILSSFLEVTPWMLIFFFVGVFAFFMKRNGFMLAWIIGSFSVLFAVTHKESRYLTDFFPAIAITAAAGFESLAKRMAQKKFWILFCMVVTVTYALGVGYVYEAQDIGKPLKDVGRFLHENVPQNHSVVANEESQIYYYSQRKVYPFPKGIRDFEALVQNKNVLFIVINSYKKPGYAEEALEGWEEVFRKGSYTVYRRK